MMRKSYIPPIACDADGNFSTNEPEPLNVPVRNPSNGEVLHASGPSVDHKIHAMLLEGLKGVTSPPVRVSSTARVPAHLAKYLK